MNGPGVGEVLAVHRLSPNLVRIVLAGAGPAEFVSTGVPDEAVALYFPLPGQDRPEPMECRDGVWDYHRPGPAPVGRNYTVRAFDAARGEMTIDVVTHEGGVAARWAIHAEPGQQVLVTRPRSWYSPPADARWQLLVADLAGLPALARIVEEHDGSTPVRVVVEAIEAADLDCLVAGPAVTVDAVMGSGNGVAPSVLLDKVRALDLPTGPGYLWFAGEAAVSRGIRKHLRREHGWSSDRFDTVGYWRADAERWNAAYEQVQDEMFAVYQQALDKGASEKDAAEVFDSALEEAGL